MLHHRIRPTFTLSVLLFVSGTAALALAACEGQIGASRSDGTPQSADPGSPTGADNLPGFAPSPASLRRLTVTEYTNSVHDLLGDVTVSPLEDDVLDQGFTTVGAAKATISDVALDKFDSSALDLAEQVFADSTRRAKFVGCTPAVASDACVKSFVQSFGRRTFRRALTGDEIARYVGVVDGAAKAFGGDVWPGLQYATATFLESPYFLYRPDLGVADASHPGRRNYTSYEMASRLSYFLWESTPDDQLLDTADRGELLTREGVVAAAARLLASPRADAALASFFDENLLLRQLDKITKDATVYPNFAATMGSAMRTEMQMMIKDAVFAGDGDFRRIFDTPTSFVNADLAKLYGIAGVTGDSFSKVTLPADKRFGIVTTAGLLALNSRTYRTSPTERGEFLMQRLLCWEPGNPPPNAQNGVDAPTGTATWTTMRQRLEAHRANPACAGCHKVMDPPGLSLEHYDGIGAWRDTDNGVALDVSGDLGGAPFDGAKGLAQALQKDARLPDCMTRQVYRFATGHREVKGEEPVIAQLKTQLTGSGWKLRELAKNLVVSDGFRFATDPR